MGYGMHRKTRSQPRRLRCTIIGAGISGLLFAYKLRKHLDSYVEFTVYEKNPDLGGTWYENRYPGCACDVPSHVYQFPWAPNPAWSQFYASSQEIHAYLKHVAHHFNLDRFIKFNSKVTAARWSDESHAWTVDIEDGGQIHSEILVNASGILNNPQVPIIDGYSSFSGEHVHTAAWDSSIDLKDKRIAVIGAGASAIQMLPKIQPLARHIDVYIRTPSWITPPVAAPSTEMSNHAYSEDEKEQFRWNEKSYLRTRKDMEAQFNRAFRNFFKDSAQQKEMRSTLQSRMKTLIADEQLQKKLIPPFEVGCRRINPGEPYLAALQQSNVQPIFDTIEKITPGGVVVGGIEHPAEVLISATGFNTSFRPRFPIVGRKGVNLQDQWAEEPISYMGTGVAGFPNYLIFLGPNTPIANGSLIGSLEATGDYFIRLIRKMIRQNVTSFDVQVNAQREFDQHTQTFMKQTVWTGSCRSWYKRGLDGRVSALWPGSSLHYIQTLAENRWEDYHWEHANGRFEYWGSGISWIEDPALDPLGLAEVEKAEESRTIPRKDSDVSFYLYESTPLPLYREAGSTQGITVPV